MDKIEDMIRSGQTGCDSVDKDKGQSTVDEEDEDEDPPTMTSTPIKAAAAAVGGVAGGGGGGEAGGGGGGGSGGHDGKSGQYSSRPVDIMKMEMDVDSSSLSTPTDVYKVSAYCVT